MPRQGMQVQSKSVRSRKDPCQYLDLGCSEVRCARWPLAPALAGPFGRVGSPLQADDILPLLKCCYLSLCGRELLQHKPMQHSVPAPYLWPHRDCAPPHASRAFMQASPPVPGCAVSRKQRQKSWHRSGMRDFAGRYLIVLLQNLQRSRRHWQVKDVPGSPPLTFWLVHSHLPAVPTPA